MSASALTNIRIAHPDEVYLGGRWVRAEGDLFEIISPSTGEVALVVRLPSPAQADEAVAVAVLQGLPGWALCPVSERISLIGRFCEAIEARLGEIGTLWAVEAGMPLRHSGTLHKFGAVGAWTAALHVAEDALREEMRSSALGDVLVRREPAGIVVAVLPYNGPLVSFATKVIPALLAGCPVVVKAASESQLTMRVVAECAEISGLPAGALTVFCAGAEIGERLTRNAHVDMVSFTGGHTAAQAVIEATRQRYARTSLELGGKSPALVLDDAPIPQVLKSLVPGMTGGTGQVCAALTRVIVTENRFDELVAALKEKVSQLRIGDPLDPATQIGPLISDMARERTEGFIRRAVQEGGHIVAGGGRPAAFNAGFYFEPTIITGLGENSELVQNEVFGPVTVVLASRDEEDSLRIANNSKFGLGASVYTADRAKALVFAGRLQSGSVALNTYGPTVAQPYGGRKTSGWGREGGPEGIQEFTELKQIVLGPGLS